MIVFIFLLLIAALVSELFAKHKLTTVLLIITLLVASFWFSHHVTNHLNIDL